MRSMLLVTLACLAAAVLVAPAAQADPTVSAARPAGPAPTCECPYGYYPHYRCRGPAYLCGPHLWQPRYYVRPCYHPAWYGPRCGYVGGLRRTYTAAPAYRGFRGGTGSVR